jgi:DNA repair protein RAD50
LNYICTSEAEERNELNNDPRRLQITKEIRDMEDSMEKLRRKIDDETSILQSLKLNADAQSSLLTLQEQCDKDVDVLDDNIREESYTLNKFDIFPPTQLPRDDDDDGDQLANVIMDLMEKARQKYDVAESSLEKSTDEIVSIQKIIAEKSALLAGNQKSLALLKSKKSSLTNSVLEILKTVDELRRHEAQQGYKLTVSEDEPRNVIEYIDQRLQEVEDDVPELNPARTSKRVAKRLRKLVCRSRITVC